MKTASFIQTAGEPRVIGTVFSMTKGSVSAPIAGNSGVFVVSPISDPLKPEMPADLTLFRRQVLSSTLSSVRQNLLNSMKKAADVKDNAAVSSNGRLLPEQDKHKKSRIFPGKIRDFLLPYPSH